MTVLSLNSGFASLRHVQGRAAPRAKMTIRPIAEKLRLHVGEIFLQGTGVLGRLALALAPFSFLAWIFIAR